MSNRPHNNVGQCLGHRSRVGDLSFDDVGLP